MDLLHAMSQSIRNVSLARWGLLLVICAFAQATEVALESNPDEKSLRSSLGTDQNGPINTTIGAEAAYANNRTEQQLHPSRHYQHPHPNENYYDEEEEEDYDEDGANMYQLIEWLASQNGGYVSEKLFFREDGEVYAMEAITENEILIVLPKSAVFATNPQQGPADIEATYCDATVRMVHQYIDPSSGPFGPYVKFLFETVAPNLHYPMAWSNAGKQLMRDIVGLELEPQSFGDYPSFNESCQHAERWSYLDPETHDLSERLLESAWQFIYSRDWGDKYLLPVVDMIPHRNGESHNVDFLGTRTAQDYWAYQVGAIRNIAAGEEIHISYNECRNPEFCPEELYLHYLTPELLIGKGFLESFPRRFGFTTGYEDSEDLYLIFEVADETESSAKFLTSTGRPNPLQFNFIQAHLKRLIRMEDEVQARIATELSHPVEISTTQTYFLALRRAMEQAYHGAQSSTRHKTAWGEFECFSSGGLNATTKQHCQHEYSGSEEDGIEPYFDDLKPRPDTNSYAFEISNCNSRLEDIQLAEVGTSSFYQRIDFDHFMTEGVGNHDTCLTLGDFPQSCTSFRPHYHEIFVHYPASFIKNVRRVLFMGGGDLMILFEILKYKSLEVAYGLELDQEVVRQSFRHYGIQPSFDDPRVKWYFGDAAKSILTIPKELYGTFDVVYIDLMDYVADTVMVAQEISLLDMAARLVSPNGVIAQNRDFPQQDKPTLTKFAVDATFGDIPNFCQEYISLSSNGINFATAKTHDHQVPSLFYKAHDEDYYRAWTNFHNNPNIGDLENVPVALANRSIGLFTAIEAEECAVSLDNPNALKEKISQALSESGLSEVDHVYSSLRENATDTNFFDSVHSFVLREGILIVRNKPSKRYLAVDLQLWGAYDLQDVLLSGLKNAVGINSSASTFRVSTGGMFGTQNKIGIPEPPKSFSQSDKRIGNPWRTFPTILREILQIIPSSPSKTLVLCGEHYSTCSSFDALQPVQHNSEHLIVPIWGCPGTTGGLTTEIDMRDCEKTIRQQIHDTFDEVHALVIDPMVSRQVGQVIHKILSQPFLTHEFLAETFVVIAPSLENHNDDWTESLLERFRTEMVVFNPVYLVEAAFGSKDSSIQMKLFSAGDSLFYSRLTKAGKRITGKIGAEFAINNGKSGVTSYTPEFNATTLVFDEDYDVNLSLAQWNSQTPVAYQEVLQMEIEERPSPQQFSPGERVLANYKQHPFEGKWAIGTLNNLTGNETHYSIRFQTRSSPVILEAKRIRRLINLTYTFAKGELVLIKHNPDSNEIERWRQGYIKERNGDATYQVRIMTLDEDLTIASAPSRDLMPLYEKTPALRETEDEITSVRLEKTLDQAILESEIEANVSLFDSEDLGLGCILLATWKMGNIAVIWDGKKHVDLNLLINLDNGNFTSHAEVFRNAFTNRLGLKVVGRDSMPRGWGKVVNLPLPTNDTIWFGTFRSD